MHYMDEEAARLVVRFLRSATVNHHVTPLATGSSAARRLARAAAARRGTAGRRRSVSPRAHEPGGTGPSGRVRAFRPDRSSWRLCNWCRETAHQPASPKAAGDSCKGVFLSPAPVAVNLQTISPLPSKLVATTLVYSETSRIDFCTHSHPLV